MLLGGTSQADYRFNFDIFTSNSSYHDSPDVDTYVVVSNGEEAIVDFTFYNASTIDSSVARIFFDDGSLLDIANIINGPGTLFSEGAPGSNNLPSGENIGFYADREFTIGADPPPSQNGIDNPPPEEWVTIRFNLVSGANLQGVINELITGDLRVGIHIISLPDGLSESAIMVVPEPATLMLLAAGAAAVLRKRKR
jgi:hypothetical protein